jgi:hypothetical protein
MGIEPRLSVCVYYDRNRDTEKVIMQDIRQVSIQDIRQFSVTGVRWRRSQGSVGREFSSTWHTVAWVGWRAVQFVCFSREHGFYFIPCSLKSRHVWRWGVWFISIPAPCTPFPSSFWPQSVIENFQYICVTRLHLVRHSVYRRLYQVYEITLYQLERLSKEMRRWLCTWTGKDWAESCLKCF